MKNKMNIYTKQINNNMEGCYTYYKKHDNKKIRLNIELKCENVIKLKKYIDNFKLCGYTDYIKIEYGRISKGLQYITCWFYNKTEIDNGWITIKDTIQEDMSLIYTSSYNRYDSFSFVFHINDKWRFIQLKILNYQYHIS
jgi:hypothetical protein